jgi:hypothetical protein
MVRWNPPDLERMKYNADGAFMLKDNQAVFSEVIHDDSGSWQIGFSRNLGACSILMAEHWSRTRQ